MAGGEIQTQALISPAALGNPEDERTYGGLGIPENVFLIGTVNMDETTHPFSKKSSTAPAPWSSITSICSSIRKRRFRMQTFPLYLRS